MVVSLLLGDFTFPKKLIKNFIVLMMFYRKPIAEPAPDRAPQIKLAA